MEAQRSTAAVFAVLAVCSLFAPTVADAASARSQNFIVSAPSQALARELCEAAESQRRDLAIEWLGQELPPWQQPCPIECKIHPQLGAGGATQFSFSRSGVPFGWVMSVQGSRERVLDSVLPHEITHTIFASHFGRPLPRWADEGACTTVEHMSEKSKQERFLIDFLMNERGIPFNKMFAMKEYPADMLPLYAQGYSLARYLIMQGGKRKFVQYVGEGMQADNWPAATRKYYGHKDLSDLQVTWLGWVKSGSPRLEPVERSLGRDEIMLASNTKSIDSAESPFVDNPQTSVVASPVTQVPPNVIPNHALVTHSNAAATAPSPNKLASHNRNVESVSPPRPEYHTPANVDSRPASNVSRPNSAGGWYARRRDEAQQQGNQTADFQTNRPAVAPPEPAPLPPVGGQPQNSPAPLPRDRRVMLEWSRPLNQPWSPTQAVATDTNPVRSNELLTRRDLAADSGPGSWR